MLQPPAASKGPWIRGGSGTNTAFWGPWGVSYAANLTPDATGLGPWTAEQFIQAMRSGKHAGTGRPIVAPMPWQHFGQLTDADLQAGSPISNPSHRCATPCPTISLRLWSPANPDPDLIAGGVLL
ncbi:MAG: hypothetical protein LBJ15_05510 [Comamonas sp.]|uniref:hypothetical protein n=1 Tax=Comamonas sp. TaxID=34028 RepID=UPI0028291E38|nr:hypothetical protein [Comamonas sp.]MDR0213448.1 hypothetical protein [Comamonas sp.]